MRRVKNVIIKYWLAAVIVLVLGAGGYWYIEASQGSVQVHVVTRGTFVQQVSVSGTVMADREADLGFVQGGRVASVLVAEGQKVSAGSVLATIENDDARASLLQRQAALDRARAELASLKRGTRPEELSVSESTLRGAAATVQSAQQSVVDSLLEGYSDADTVIRTTVDKMFSNPNSNVPQFIVQTSESGKRVLIETLRGSVGNELEAWSTDTLTLNVETASGVPASVAQARLTNIATLLAHLSTALGGAIPTTQTTQTIIDGYKAEVGAARVIINAAISELSTRVSTVNDTIIALETARKNDALLRAGASAEDVRALEASVAAAAADVLQASAVLSKTEIRAPFSGTVTKVIAKVGTIAAANVPQVSLIGGGIYEIESYVPELSVSLVKVGDPARVTFDSYGEDVAFQATVSSVDIGETIRDGVATYRTVLTFSENDSRIRSGMTANIGITALTKEGVIAIPQGLVKKFDGIASVQVETPQGVEERVVTTGAVSSLGSVEILTGLNEGDRVIIE
ncbi:MAG: hypothetical protein RLZZ283_685 [Candidatus Parcubacteria bacterium]|jgi:multidrug efflux pump subunit AcrA (membrane-fusion protein)